MELCPNTYLKSSFVSGAVARLFQNNIFNNFMQVDLEM